MCIRDRCGSTEEHLTVTQFKVQAEQQRLEAVTGQVAQAGKKVLLIDGDPDVYKRQGQGYRTVRDQIHRLNLSCKMNRTTIQFHLGLSGQYLVQHCGTTYRSKLCICLLYTSSWYNHGSVQFEKRPSTSLLPNLGYKKTAILIPKNCGVQHFSNFLA